MIKILQHKIKRSTFVGIYQYEENRGSLEDAVNKGNLNHYDKFSYMLKIAKILETIHADRDPKNTDLIINLEPNNFLLLKKAPYSVGLIDLFEDHKSVKDFKKSLREKLWLKVSDYDLIKPFDAKARNIYSLGLLFFFICFEKSFIENTFDQNDEIVTFSDQLDESEKAAFHPKIIKLIREMLNESPIDRPKLGVVIKILKKLKYSKEFLLNDISEQVSKNYVTMQREVQQELFLRNQMLDEGQDKIKSGTLSKKIQEVNSKIQRKIKKLDDEYYRNYKTGLDSLSPKSIQTYFMIFKNIRFFKLFSKKDKYMMLNDMDFSDKLSNLDEVSDLRGELMVLHNEGIYLNDFLDCINIGQILTSSSFEMDNLVFQIQKNANFRVRKTTKNYIWFLSITVTYYLLQEIQRQIDLFSRLQEKRKGFFLESKNNDCQSAECVNQIGLSSTPYFIVFGVSPLLIVGLVMSLFLRRSKVGVYHKKGFSTFISF